MPMHISPTIDTDLGRMATMFPQISPIGKSLSPATQSDILGILQREQDRAVALLSSSPLLASLFVSYANQAAAFETTTPSTETEEWKALEKMISTLQEELDKLKPENLKMTESLETATAALEAFRSQVASLKETNMQQKQDIDSLRADLFESKLEYTLLVEDSNAERDTLRSTISDLEAQRAEMKDTIVQQQLKISKLEHQASSSFSAPPPFGTTAEKREKDEQEAKDSSCGEVKRKNRKRPSSVAYPELGSTLGKNSGPPKHTSSVLQEQLNNVWGGTKKYDPSALPPITTSLVPGGTFGPLTVPAFARKDSLCSSEADELRTPPTKEGEIDVMTSPSSVVTPIMSARVPASPANARFPDRESRPPSPQSPYLSPAPEVAPTAFLKSTPVLPKTPKGVMEGVPRSPKDQPSPSPSPALTRPQVTTPAPLPANTEPEKPLSLWERKKLKQAALEGGSGGGNAETIATPSPVGTGGCQSVFADMPRDVKRENQREVPIEGFLGSNPVRRRNDSAPLWARPSAPLLPKGSGWGSWGTSLLNTVSSAVADPDRLPSPSPLPLKPKIEDPPRGFAPTRPPKNQPAAFGSLNKPAWGRPGDKSAWGGLGDNTQGVVKDGPRDTSGPSSTSGPGTSKNIMIDTPTKLPEGRPITTEHSLGWLEGGVPPPIKEKGPERPTVEIEVPAKEDEMSSSEEEFSSQECVGKKDRVTSGFTVSSPPDVPDHDSVLTKKKKKKTGRK